MRTRMPKDPKFTEIEQADLTKKSDIEHFLGVRVLTPLEENAVVGGIVQDHDHDDWGGHTHDHG